jgi:hypothetical protein
MATKRGSFPGVNPEREFAKPVFEFAESGCCIISAYTAFHKKQVLINSIVPSDIIIYIEITQDHR